MGLRDVTFVLRCTRKEFFPTAARARGRVPIRRGRAREHITRQKKGAEITGRKRTFTSGKKLEAAAEAYFRSISYETKHPELAEAVEKINTRFRAYLERELLTREKSVQGVIFNLQNNYGWRARNEIEMGAKTRATMAAAEIPLSEREALLKEIAREFAEQPGGGEGDGAEEG